MFQMKNFKHAFDAAESIGITTGPVSVTTIPILCSPFHSATRGLLVVLNVLLFDPEASLMSAPLAGTIFHCNCDLNSLAFLFNVLVLYKVSRAAAWSY